MNEGPSIGRFLVDLPDNDAATALSGPSQKTLQYLAKITDTAFVIRGLQLEVTGLPAHVERAAGLLEIIRHQWEKGQTISLADVQVAVNAIDSGSRKAYEGLSKKIIARSQKGNCLTARTLNQQSYVEAMENHDLTFAIGPAGTGKTFLAAVLAVRMLTKREVKRLVLTRPAVEAGESLGFLPGDLQQKVDPYLRPLYDALHSLLGLDKTTTLLEKGLIEVAPLAYMRGRTLDEAFVILDEAQNTTSSQMRMFLTRLGDKSRMVVTGDITQIDLPPGKKSGLVEAAELLKNVDGVSVCHLTSFDIVRHPLVQRVVNAYSSKDS